MKVPEGGVLKLATLANAWRINRGRSLADNKADTFVKASRLYDRRRAHGLTRVHRRLVVRGRLVAELWMTVSLYDSTMWDFAADSGA